MALVVSGHSPAYERSNRLDGHVGDSSTFSVGVHAVDPTWDGGFCIGSINGQGCVATMLSSGTPSLRSGQPFTVTTSEIRTAATSMLIYGFEPADGPSSGGRLCIYSPLKRTRSSNSQGAGPCTGTHVFDFSTLGLNPMHPGLAASTQVYGQTWNRDTTPSMSSVRQGLVFTVLP